MISKNQRMFIFWDGGSTYTSQITARKYGPRVHCRPCPWAQHGSRLRTTCKRKKLLFPVCLSLKRAYACARRLPACLTVCAVMTEQAAHSRRQRWLWFSSPLACLPAWRLLPAAALIVRVSQETGKGGSRIPERCPKILACCFPLNFGSVSAEPTPPTVQRDGVSIGGRLWACAAARRPWVLGLFTLLCR